MSPHSRFSVWCYIAAYLQGRPRGTVSCVLLSHRRADARSVVCVSSTGTSAAPVSSGAVAPPSKVFPLATPRSSSPAGGGFALTCVAVEPGILRSQLSRQQENTCCDLLARGVADEKSTDIRLPKADGKEKPLRQREEDGTLTVGGGSGAGPVLHLPKCCVDPPPVPLTCGRSGTGAPRTVQGVHTPAAMQGGPVPGAPGPVGCSSCAYLGSRHREQKTGQHWGSSRCGCRSPLSAP